MLASSDSENEASTKERNIHTFVSHDDKSKWDPLSLLPHNNTAEIIALNQIKVSLSAGQYRAGTFLY